MKTTRLGLATLAALIATPALAHPGHGVTLLAGVEHPLTGLDHLLAMVTVGLWAALRGGKALWAWPAAFVSAMVSGYFVGLFTPAAPMIGSTIEALIVASVIALAVFAAVERTRLAVVSGLPLIAAIGLVHGFAHGSEAPAGAGLSFPLGMALATVALHAVGVIGGRTLLAARRLVPVRAR
jgi:urease accessory protein